MNPFDQNILLFINQFAHRSWLFDSCISVVVDAPLLKGGVLMLLFWWQWFRADDDTPRRREILMASLVSCIVVLFVARGLANVMPFRMRPMHEGALHFVLPYSVSQASLMGWSSFPSDHAALFFALAAGLAFASRRLGLWAMAYVFAFICLPRLYVGIHYPTDILVGMILGGGVAWIGNWLRGPISVHGLRWMTVHPSSFYAAFFLITSQIVTLFEDVRSLGGFLLYLAKHGLHGGG